MRKLFAKAGTGLIFGAAFLLVMTPALAGGQPQVDWSVSIGSPGYYPPAVVYAPPPVVYVQPQPVYVSPVPVPQYQEPVYVYGRPWGYGNFKHHRHHERHHYDDD
jgi:hypothetical protein